MKGLEPPRLTTQDPKSCAATITPHPHFKNRCKGIHFLFFMKSSRKKILRFIHFSINNFKNNYESER